MSSGSWRRPRTQNPALYWTLYALAWVAMALPLAWDVWAGQTGGDYARQQANVDMGRWAWRFLLLALAIRPAAQLLGRPALFRYRRLLGLFAFAYAFIHSLDYLLYAHAWSFPLRVWERRVYLPVGIAATLLMTPLAATSLDGVRRRMGPTAWRRLHQAIYALGVLVAVHALWEEGVELSQSIVCTVLLALLLALRLPWGQRLLARVHSPRSARVTGNTRRLAS